MNIKGNYIYSDKLFEFEIDRYYRNRGYFVEAESFTKIGEVDKEFDLSKSEISIRYIINNMDNAFYKIIENFKINENKINFIWDLKKENVKENDDIKCVISFYIDKEQFQTNIYVFTI